MKKHLEDRGIYITFPQLIVRILFDLGGFLLTLLPAALTLYLTDVWIGSGTLIPLSWMLGIVSAFSSSTSISFILSITMHR